MNKVLKGGSSSEENCPVCLQNYEGQKIYCGSPYKSHGVCSDCYPRLNKCPICRGNMPGNVARSPSPALSRSSSTESFVTHVPQAGQGNIMNDLEMQDEADGVDDIWNEENHYIYESPIMINGQLIRKWVKSRDNTIIYVPSRGHPFIIDGDQRVEFPPPDSSPGPSRSRSRSRSQSPARHRSQSPSPARHRSPSPSPTRESRRRRRSLSPSPTRRRNRSRDRVGRGGFKTRKLMLKHKK